MDFYHLNGSHTTYLQQGPDNNRRCAEKNEKESMDRNYYVDLYSQLGFILMLEIMISRSLNYLSNANICLIIYKLCKFETIAIVYRIDILEPQQLYVSTS